MKQTMTRVVKAQERYYTLELVCNLFEEWMVIRTYGSSKKLKPTGEIRNVYATMQEAQETMNLILCHKHQKGYRPKTTDTLNNSPSEGDKGEQQC